eukprot:518902_1
MYLIVEILATLSVYALISLNLTVVIILLLKWCQYRWLSKLSINFRRYAYTNNNNTMDFWDGMKNNDVRGLCLEFIGLNTDSQILTVSAQQDLWQLFSSHFNYKSYHNILSMPLLYSATQQTFNRYLFFKMINKE